MLKIEIRSFWSSIFLILCLVLSGCMRTGPYTLPRDQFDYAKAIGDAKKEQILLNIVKLRYAEFPVFLEVNQVVAGYNWEQTGTAALADSLNGQRSHLLPWEVIALCEVY